MLQITQILLLYVLRNLFAFFLGHLAGLPGLERSSILKEVQPQKPND